MYDQDFRDSSVTLSTGDYSIRPEGQVLIKSHVRLRPFFKLYIINVLMQLITLGFYRFWGKTEIRRHMWSHVECLGDRFEYTGTAKDLIKGFLIVLVVFLLPLVIIRRVASVFVIVGMEISPKLLIAEYLINILFIVFFFSVATFSARRYKLSRTNWRGIHSAQKGSALVYGLLYVGCVFITLLTVGLAWPACSVVLMRYKMAHTWIGTQQLGFEPSIGVLYKSFVVVWTALAGLLFLEGYFFQTLLLEFYQYLQESDLEMAVMAFMTGLPGLLFLIPVVPGIPLLLWYRGKTLHHFVESSSFMGRRLSSVITGWGYLELVISNTIMTVLTLGLAVPFTMMRQLSYVEKHVGLSGDGNFAELLQSEVVKPGAGEGLADAFDVGAI